MSRVIKNLLLAFQLEGYENMRFLKFAYTHLKFWIIGSNRSTLIWTKKAIFLCTGSAIMFFVVLFFVLFSGGAIIYTLLGIGLILYGFPFLLVLTNLLISPVDVYLKNNIISKAKQKIKTYKNLIVIGITGSYGKTSTKDIIATLLKEKFKVLTSEGNKNTPLGISETILRSLDENVEIFIVEMGAYVKGDIKAICDIVNPQIGILTGITMQHLERFKSLENIIKTKFELIQSLPKNGLAIIDKQSSGVRDGYNSLQDSFTVEKIITIDSYPKFHYLPELTGMSFELDGKEYTTKLLAKHSLQTIQIAYELGKYLGLSVQEITRGINAIEFSKHRMELIRNLQTGVNIIDDSYNGNIEGIKSLVDLLKNIKVQGRKIIISAGIVELGERGTEVNAQVGKDLSTVADIICLVSGPIGDAIYTGLIEMGYDKKKIKVYACSIDAHKDLSNFLMPQDLVIFQNDLPDIYI